MRAKDCFLSVELKIRYITYLFGCICTGGEMTDNLISDEHEDIEEDYHN